MEQPEQEVVEQTVSTNLPRLETTVRAPSTAPGTTIFDVRDVSIFYGSFKAVTGVSLPIYEHEVTAFIGSSGSGKSTVLRALNRMNDLVPGARVDGEMRYRGTDLYGKGVSATAVSRRIGMVFQKPNPFPKSIYDNVAYGPRINGIRNKARLDEIVERSLRSAVLWDEVKNRLKQSGLALSGGQAQRLCIARTIAVEPDVVLMDEPASALDPIATLAVEDLSPRTQAELHDRHRDPQHAAGDPGQRPHRVLLGPHRLQERHPHRHPRRVRARPSRSSRTRTTAGPRPTSPAGWANGKVHNGKPSTRNGCG